MKKIVIVGVMFAAISMHITSQADLMDVIGHSVTAYNDLKASLATANANLKIMKAKDKETLAKAKATLGLVLGTVKPIEDLIIVLQDVAPAIKAVSSDAADK